MIFTRNHIFFILANPIVRMMRVGHYATGKALEKVGVVSSLGE